MFYNIAVKPCLLCDRYTLNVNAEMPGFSLKDHCKSSIQNLSVPAADTERFCCYTAACVYAEVFRQWAYRMRLDFFSIEECYHSNALRVAFIESCMALAKPEWFAPLLSSVQPTEPRAIDYNRIDYAVNRLSALFIENIEKTGSSVWCFDADFNFLTLIGAHASHQDNDTVNVGALFSAAESSRLPDPADYPAGHLVVSPDDSIGSQPPQAEPYTGS